ncbi:hypothetical protein [Photorhabdus luminescens]|uniref:Uncharacterized protein n=1 Tax=Photorhabdus luminescens subsp. mexicana TaxID=2100167 RepID=A0A4R4IP11_PHOLU|nr:hypothetical protein [Photorhabdus luminescens]TDB42061.1 hypothetical protein C5468_25365 [Photorhabdus luminescens subsp. mexicana]
MTNNLFHITQIVASVWGDPADMTDAIWQAGYRKPERTAGEIGLLTIDVMNGVPDWVSHNERPKDLNDILRVELNNIIFDVTWDGKATPVSVVKAVLASGYTRERNE